MPTQPAPTPPELPRVLSTAHTASAVVGIIIGSGIFLVSREMTAAVVSSARVYLVWIVGGLLSLAGAMTYAEIASSRPRVGGEYAFLREAYGDTTAFLYMWTWVLIAKPASMATIAAGLVRVLGTFAAFSFFTRPALGPILWAQIIAIAVTWLIIALNIVSTLDSANLQLALTWLKIAIVTVIAGACILFAGPHGLVANLHTTVATTNTPFAGFMIALVAALWAYDGWSDVTQLAGEVRHPRRSLPLALVGGVATVGLLYMLTNAAISYVLPASAIASTDRPAADAMRLVAGPWGASLVSLGMAISIASSFVGSSLSGARVPFAAARDGLFFRTFAHISPRFHTPSTALLLQATLATLLLLVLGHFQSLFSLAIFAEWLFYALTASTVFVFRRRDAISPPLGDTLSPELPQRTVISTEALRNPVISTEAPTNSVISTEVPRNPVPWTEAPPNPVISTEAKHSGETCGSTATELTPAIKPFRTPGYPVVPLLFIAAAILLLVFSFRAELAASLAGSAAILLGLPVHLLLRRRRSTAISPI